VTLYFGCAVTSAVATWLSAPRRDAPGGVTLGGASVGVDGSWTPNAPEPLPVNGSSVAVPLAAASATLVQVTLAASTPNTTPSIAAASIPADGGLIP